MKEKASKNKLSRNKLNLGKNRSDRFITHEGEYTYIKPSAVKK